jgi:uncharacterized membrane protein YfcA
MLAVAAIAALAGAALQSAGGFGFALVLGPALVAARGPQEAVTALLVLGVVLNLLVLGAERRKPAVRWRDVAPMAVAALPGLAAGAVLVGVMSKSTLQIVIGVAVLAAAVAARSRRSPAQRPLSRTTTVPAGLLAGALTTSTGVNGPPLALWLQARGARPLEVRDSLAAGFALLNVAGAIAIAAAGGSAATLDAGALALLLPLTVAGHAVGRRVLDGLGEERLARLTFTLVLVAGAASVVAGLAAKS